MGAPKTPRGCAWRTLAIIGLLLSPWCVFGASAALDPITVEAQKERAKIQHDVDQFISSAMMHYWDRPLLRWNSPVCPLVAGLSRDQGEFILRRLSQVIRDAGAPLAPEKCKANFLVLVSSEPEALLRKLRKKSPRMFDDHDGEGTIQHFLRTQRPIRVWYNWSYSEADSAAFSTAASISGTNSPSAAGAGYTVVRSPNSRLGYGAGRSIVDAIVVVDLPSVKEVNFGQLTDYVAMIGLAEINLDKTIVNAPTVLHLFDTTSGAPQRRYEPVG
jgi:hypothetical protein